LLRSSAIARVLLGLALSGGGSLLPADADLKPFTASFGVSRGALPLGSLELKFTLDERGEYRYHAHTQPGLLSSWFSGEEIVEESQGRLRKEGPQPRAYRYVEQGNPKDDLEVQFDWSAMRAVTTSGGVTWNQDIEPGTQDRLSQQLMVRLQLAQGQREFAYQVADGGKLKEYHFRVVGEETVKTPRGRLRCLKVERSKEQRPPDYLIWFAPDLDYLPVRIERKLKSGHYRMKLEELEGL